MSSYVSKSKTSPTPHLSMRKARVETCRTSHVRAKKRSFERTAKWIRVRRVAARQVISLMQPRRIHPTKCTSLRRGGFGGEEKRRSTEEKKTKSTVFLLGRMHRREVHASQPRGLLVGNRSPARMIIANYEIVMRDLEILRAHKIQSHRTVMHQNLI